MVIALALTWTGFLVVSWGRHMLAGDNVGIADLAIPGHYAKGIGAAQQAGIGLTPGGTGIPGLQGGPPLVNGQVAGAPAANGPTSGGGGGGVRNL